MSRNKNNIDPNADRGLIDKVSSGDLRHLDVADGAQIAELATGLLPGAAGQLASVPLSAVTGELQAEKEMDRYRKKFGNLDSMASRSHGVKRKLQEWRTRWRGRLGEAASSAGGALAGGALTGALAMSGPAGWLLGIAGMMGGGYAANKLYNKAFPRQGQDALQLAAQIDQARAQGEEIPQEVVFATLAANLPDRIGNIIEKRLKRETGTREFDVALNTEGNERALNRMMNDPTIDVAIRASNPMHMGAQELTALVNSGEMSGKDLLDPISYLQRKAHQEALAGQQQYLAGIMPSPKPMPDLGTLARDMAARGITPVVGDDGQLHPLPAKPGQNRLV